jgi:ribA/ribD-fused uncharacterized protein
MTIKDFTGERRWLSNFQPSCVSYDGVDCKTVEHAYQAAKTVNIVEQEWVRNAPTPGQARKRGQTVTLRLDWEDVKLSVMTELVYQKFSGNRKLKELLVGTGNEHLIEGNYWNDTFWGVCGGQGLNHLGRILMDTRALLRNT